MHTDLQIALEGGGTNGTNGEMVPNGTNGYPDVLTVPSLTDTLRYLR